jgi:hypothetical protein
VKTTALVLLVASAVSTTGRAQDALTARIGELPLGSPYVPVRLDSVANDPLAIASPADRVQLLHIPFDLVTKPGATHLFLKPIGWSAWNNEAAEYPSYIANYDNRDANTNNPARAIVQVPVADYAAAWLLASCDNDTNLSNVVTLRLGVLEGQARVVYHDFVATVPRANDPNPTGVVKTIPTAAGNFYLVRIAMGKIIAQDFPERSFLDLDITKELRVAINLPDPYRFQIRPLGPSSGVRIYGLTLERAPVSMVVKGAEPGNVFTEPQTPAFHLDLRNVRNEHWIPSTIQAVAVSDSGVATTNEHPKEYRVAAWVYSLPTEQRTITVPVKERGHYRLRINIVRGGEVIAYRETTFALLAPDTRKHREESPFGTWDFFGGHITPNDMNLLGPLYVKLGMRYGPGSASEADRQKYGLLDGSDPRIRGTNDLTWIREAMAKEPGKPPPARFLTFHESAISGPHLTRTPDMFTGRPAYKMSEAEQKTCKELWAEAEARLGRGISARNIRARVETEVHQPLGSGSRCGVHGRQGGAGHFTRALLPRHTQANLHDHARRCHARTKAGYKFVSGLLAGQAFRLDHRGGQQHRVGDVQLHEPASERKLRLSRGRAEWDRGETQTAVRRQSVPPDVLDPRTQQTRRDSRPTHRDRPDGQRQRRLEPGDFRTRRCRCPTLDFHRRRATGHPKSVDG